MISSSQSCSSLMPQAAPLLSRAGLLRPSEVALTHRETIVLSQTMTDLQTEHNTDPAFMTWAKMNDIRNRYNKCPYLTLATPQCMYSGPVCRLKLDQGESVHLRPLGLPMGRRGQDGGTEMRRWRGLRTGIKQDIKSSANQNKNLCVSGSVVTGNGVYMSMNGRGFNDIMLSLPLGNSNYTRPFPVYHQPPLIWRGILYSVGEMFFTLKKKQCSDRVKGLIRQEGKTKESRAKNAAIPTYYNRLVKTWRAEKFLPTELANNTMAALSLPSWHSNYTSLRNAETSGRSWSFHFLIFFLYDRHAYLLGRPVENKQWQTRCPINYRCICVRYVVGVAFRYMLPQGRTKGRRKGFYSVISASRDDPAGRLWKTLGQKTSIAGLKLQLECGPCISATYKESLSHKPTQAEETWGEGVTEWANKWVFTSKNHTTWIQARLSI